MSSEQYQSLVKFIDEHCSCRRLSSTAEIVEEVNWHHHTKSCKKKSGNCRFNCPKFPSDRTITSQPMEHDRDSDEYKSKLQSAKTILASVIDILCTLPTNKSELYEYICSNSIIIEWVLNKANVSYADYYESLSLSMYGNCVILKRDMTEIHINNYNPELIKAWDGNLYI